MFYRCFYPVCLSGGMWGGGEPATPVAPVASVEEPKVEEPVPSDSQSSAETTPAVEEEVEMEFVLTSSAFKEGESIYKKRCTR